MVDNEPSLKAAALMLHFVAVELFEHVVDPAKVITSYVATAS
jgi:hypothetical protein